MAASTSVKWPLSRMTTSRTSANRSLMILVVRAGEQLRVFVEQPLQGRLASECSSTIQVRILAVKAGSCRIDSCTWKMAASLGPTWLATFWYSACRSAAVCREPVDSAPILPGLRSARAAGSRG